MSADISARPEPAARPPVRHRSREEEVRALLEEHREARLDQIKALTFAEPTDSDLDPGARLRATSAATLTLAEIDLAVLRLQDGSYGLCAGCAVPIPAERLLTVPYARYCVPCS